MVFAEVPTHWNPVREHQCMFCSGIYFPLFENLAMALNYFIEIIGSIHPQAKKVSLVPLTVNLKIIDKPFLVQVIATVHTF